MKIIRHTTTLFYYDGPQVFEAEDGNGGHYIALMVESKNEHDRFVVAGVELDRLRKFRMGLLDLRSLLLERSNGEWFLGESNGQLEAPMEIQEQRTPLSDSSFLPDEGFLLQPFASNPDSEVRALVEALSGISSQRADTVVLVGALQQADVDRRR